MKNGSPSYFANVSFELDINKALNTSKRIEGYLESNIYQCRWSCIKGYVVK